MPSIRKICGASLLSIAAACGGSSGPPPSTTSATVPETVRVAIANDGATTFDGTKVDGAELTNRARDAARAQPHLKIVVDAEREVSFQLVMAAVEKMRAGGVSNVTFGSMLASPPTGTTPSPTAKSSPPNVGAAGPATGPTPEPHASVAVGTKWDCPFPLPNERGGKEEANVLVVVHVENDGKPLSVDVLEDPGGGFGAAAKKCALEKAYQAPRDVNGKPLRATTFPFYIHFVMK
jgi:hypothetical protein